MKKQNRIQYNDDDNQLIFFCVALRKQETEKEKTNERISSRC